jgi:hypothetical protein
VRAGRVVALAVLAVGGLLGASAPDDELAGFERTPPRLAWVQGEVSFLRPGADGWAPAPVNLPLAPGDRLYSGEGGALEIQLGARDFLRAGARTELALEGHEPDFLQLRLGAGLASLDLRGLPPGHGVEVGTPHAALAIETGGEYRVDVAADATRLTSRRGGRALLLRPGCEPLAIAAGEHAVATASGAERYAAPERDDWDRWSASRTGGILDAVSAQWAGDVYGARELDEHGSWDDVAPYGPIWIPRVDVAWAPYAQGRWLWDPHFGWTWLDDAPWGWAPFHYGRWIFVRGRWAWAPGPLGPRLVYAPALVAFYGSPRTTVLWVPLGWGEPCRPWWGPRRWIGQPHWLGWGGPRTAVPMHVNAKLRGGAIAVPGDAFGRSPIERARIAGAAPEGLRLVRGALQAERGASYVGGGVRRIGAPAALLERPVVSTRAAQPRPRSLPGPKLVAPGERTSRFERLLPKPQRYEPPRGPKRRDGVPRLRDGAEPGAPGAIGVPARETPILLPAPAGKGSPRVAPRPARLR